MKWGKRKTRSSAKPSKDYRDARLIRTKSVNEMTNTELRALNTRIELEQKFSKLNPGKVSKGKAWLTSAVATAGLAFSIYNMVNHPASKKLIEAGKAALAAK